MTWAFKLGVQRIRSLQVVCDEDVSWRRSGFANCFLTADDVFVPVVTGQIVC